MPVSVIIPDPPLYPGGKKAKGWNLQRADFLTASSASMTHFYCDTKDKTLKMENLPFISPYSKKTVQKSHCISP